MRYRYALPGLGLGLLGLTVVVRIVSTYYIDLLTEVLILGLFAMSLNLLLGYTGIPSLGHAAYFGAAAYTTALLSLRLVQNAWISAAVGVGVSLLIIVGGAGTLFGPVLGAGVVVFLRNIVSAYTERWLFVLGLIYLLVVLCAPHGMLGALQGILPQWLYRRAEQ